MVVTCGLGWRLGSGDTRRQVTCLNTARGRSTRPAALEPPAAWTREKENSDLPWQIKQSELQIWKLKNYNSFHLLYAWLLVNRKPGGQLSGHLSLCPAVPVQHRFWASGKTVHSTSTYPHLLESASEDETVKSAKQRWTVICTSI